MSIFMKMDKLTCWAHSIFKTPAFDLISYGFESNVVGYVSIPKMDVKLAIYFGATSENMKNGAASLGYSSTPIGGVNTNTVLASHRGYRGIAMFREIEALEIGDKIYVTNFWEKLTYEVIETEVITPTDIDEIRIQEGRDMLTLITCHPYTKNYQRYVVYCEHIETDEAEELAATDTTLGLENLFKLGELSESQRRIFAETWIPIGIVSVLLLLIFSRIIVRIRNKKKN